jgi:hypothetical protein
VKILNHRAVVIIQNHRAAATQNLSLSNQRKLNNKLRKSKTMTLMRLQMLLSQTSFQGTIKMSRRPKSTPRESSVSMTTLVKSRHLTIRQQEKKSSSLELMSCQIGLPKKSLPYYLISQ